MTWGRRIVPIGLLSCRRLLLPLGALARVQQAQKKSSSVVATLGPGSPTANSITGSLRPIYPSIGLDLLAATALAGIGFVATRKQ
jgi:hypothetical protein